MSWTCPGHYKIHVHGRDSSGRPVHGHCPIPLLALQQDPSLDDIARLINSKMQSLKHTVSVPAPAHQLYFVDQAFNKLLLFM